MAERITYFKVALDGIDAMRGAGVATFVEVGPDGVLSGLGPQSVDTAGVSAAAAVSRWPPTGVSAVPMLQPSGTITEG